MKSDEVDTSRFADLDRWYALPPEVRKRAMTYELSEVEKESGVVARDGRGTERRTYGRGGPRTVASVQRDRGPGVYVSGVHGNIYTDERGRRISSRAAARILRGGGTMFGVPTGRTDQGLVSTVWGNNQDNPYSNLYPTGINAATKTAYDEQRIRREALQESYLEERKADDARWFGSLTKRQQKQFSELPAERQRYILSLDPAKRLKEGRQQTDMTDEDKKWYNNDLTERQRQQFDWLDVRRRNFILGLKPEDRLKPGRSKKERTV